MNGPIICQSTLWFWGDINKLDLSNTIEYDNIISTYNNKKYKLHLPNIPNTEECLNKSTVGEIFGIDINTLELVVNLDMNDEISIKTILNVQSFAFPFH